MILCQTCGFNVNDNMKHAIMQNTCPACGKPLFSEIETQSIAKISGRLSRAKFSTQLSAELKHDLSLFIFNELKSGLAEQIKFSEADISEEDKIAKIRDEVRSEVLPDVVGFQEDLEELTSEEIQSLKENVDPKIQRLKQEHARRVRERPDLFTEDKQSDRQFAGGFRRSA